MTDATVEKAIARIEVLIDSIGEDVREVRDLVKEQNGRVRNLEIDNASSKGGWKVAGLVGALMGTAGGIIAKIFYGS
jgi:hypothetical protein